MTGDQTPQCHNPFKANILDSSLIYMYIETSHGLRMLDHLKNNMRLLRDHNSDETDAYIDHLNKIIQTLEGASIDIDYIFRQTKDKIGKQIQVSINDGRFEADL